MSVQRKSHMKEASKFRCVDWLSQYVANLSVIKGKHNLRFGVDVYHMGLNEAQAEFLGFAYGAQGGFGFGTGPTQTLNGPAGTQYNSYAAFLLGRRRDRQRIIFLAHCVPR